jgi:hypothetical protein
MFLPSSAFLLTDRLEQGVSGVRVIDDNDPGGQVVGQFKELFAGRDRDEDFLSAFVGSQFHDADSVLNGLDGAPEIESADDDQSPFQVSLHKGGTHGEQDRDTRGRSALARIEGPELDGKFMGAGVAIAHQFLCPGIEVLLGAAYAFLERAWWALVEDLHPAPRAFGRLDAEKPWVFIRAAWGQRPYRPGGRGSAPMLFSL